MKPVARPLLAWYRRHRRSLPWRESPEPYRVWISEIMLQQTQVATVLPYFDRFITRFPTVDALAAASRQEVLAAWTGLGYYRRAEALHSAAEWIVRDNAGRFPETIEAWLKLPGIGRYTAGAILSIAFGKRFPILDGNVARVLSRLFCVRGDPREGPTREKLWSLSTSVLPRRGVSDFNQALMELGALVCTRKKPKCLVCPLASLCEANARGLQEDLPELAKRKATVPVTMAAAVVRRGDKVLLYQRPSEGSMRELWELPGGTCREGEEIRDELVREAEARYGVRLTPSEELARVEHHIMNRRITLYAFKARIEKEPRKVVHRRVWVGVEEVARYPMSSMTLKVLRGCDILKA